MKQLLCAWVWSVDTLNVLTALSEVENLRLTNTPVTQIKKLHKCQIAKKTKNAQFPESLVMLF